MPHLQVKFMFSLNIYVKWHENCHSNFKQLTHSCSCAATKQTTWKTTGFKQYCFGIKTDQLVSIGRETKKANKLSYLPAGTKFCFASRVSRVQSAVFGLVLSVDLIIKWSHTCVPCCWYLLRRRKQTCNHFFSNDNDHTARKKKKQRPAIFT